MIDFKIWKEVLTKPVEAFKKEEKKADLGKGAMHLIIAGVIAGFISGLAVLFGITAVGTMGGFDSMVMGAGVGVFAFIASLILTPIMSVIGWLIGSGIIYVFAMIFKGKGNFTNQSYLLALYGAPLMVINSILGIIPFIGPILAFLVWLYGLYLLTMAIKQVHKVSTGKAVAIWLIPVVVVAVIAAVLFVGFLMTIVPLMGAGAF